MRRTSALLVLLATVGAASARAEGVLLEKAQGQVLLHKKGTKGFRPIAEGAEVPYGDEIQTTRGATAHLSFPNGATILVKENSLFAVQGSPRRGLLSFRVGEFLIGLRNKLGKRESFEVKTPAAVAAVRGTLFWGKSDAEENSTYACFASTVSITAEGKTVDLVPGQTTRIAKGKAPEEPSPSTVKSDYLDTFAINGSIQGLKDLSETP